MKLVLTRRRIAVAIAVAAAVGLTACQAPAKNVRTTPVTSVQNAAAKTDVTQRVLSDGLYEMTYAPAEKALYVASAQGFKDVNGGVLYRLDPITLATTGQTHTDYKNFGMASDPDGHVFYTTNSLDGAVSKVDAKTGKVLKRVMFTEKGPDGDPMGAREILWHEGKLFIGAVGDPGLVWVVDAETMTLKTRIKNAGKWVTGIIYSPTADRIYAANGGGEILVINPKTYRIEQRWTPGDGKSYLFLNMATDPKTGHLFVTDDSKAKTTLVFDERTGKVIKRLDGDALGIKFDAKRNAVFISQRESKKVLQLDATTLAVKKSWSFETHPNSLLISPDGQSLYVTLKQDFNDDNSTKGPDSVARIALN
jgi:Uncharacterized conserved protein